jgi:hypothetical protein
MNHTESTLLNWYSISLQALPGVLVGAENPISKQLENPDLNAEVSVAFNYLSQGLQWRIPVQIVIADEAIPKVLSWIHTYSVESFPLSQYCRVSSASEWHANNQSGYTNELVSNRLSVWASTIVGEMLGQGDFESDLVSVPLSRAVACFSYPVARIALNNGISLNDKLRNCINRLQKIETDKRFLKRQIAVSALSSIWSKTDTSIPSNASLFELVSQILSSLNPKLADVLLDNVQIHSNSAEKRVEGFDIAVDTAILLLQTQEVSDRAQAAALIGAAAFLAGRGTSHIDLISPYLKDAPESLAWFGFFAGIAGPKFWKSDWLMLAKGVERQLRLSHKATDPSQTDLCWIEYEWLNSAQLLHEFPKQYPRLLSIEIAPGAGCQFRLEPNNQGHVAGESLTKIKKLVSSISHPGLTARQVNTVEHLLKLSNELNSVLVKFSQPEVAAAPQTALFDNEVQPSKKIGRLKTPKK